MYGRQSLYSQLRGTKCLISFLKNSIKLELLSSDGLICHMLDANLLQNSNHVIFAYKLRVLQKKYLKDFP